MYGCIWAENGLLSILQAYTLGLTLCSRISLCNYIWSPFNIVWLYMWPLICKPMQLQPVERPMLGFDVGRPAARLFLSLKLLLTRHSTIISTNHDMLLFFILLLLITNIDIIIVYTNCEVVLLLNILVAAMWSLYCLILQPPLKRLGGDIKWAYLVAYRLLENNLLI